MQQVINIVRGGVSLLTNHSKRKHVFIHFQASNSKGFFMSNVLEQNMIEAISRSLKF
jgi:hypothetical protein